MYFNGEGIVLLDPYSGDKIWFIDTQGYPNYNDITYIDFNSDGIDDQVLYKTYKSWEDDYRKVSYLICFSNNNLWIYNRSIKLDISPYSILEEVLVKNSTIILKFYRQVFGVEILLNEVIWKVDLGVPIYSFDLINIDKDPKYEIVICPDNKIFGMDILSLDIPTKSNTSVTLGPFTYNDGLTPIIYGSVYLENEDGLVLVSETDKNRELSINIHPDTYQCIL
jgi:hypothetical protein